MSRIFTCLLVIWSLWLSVAAQVLPEPMTIVSGQSVEREIAGGESHTYQIMLTAGQFLHVTVEQKSIDVALTLVAPDNKTLVQVNFTRKGLPESVSAEADKSGEYRLLVRVPSPLGSTGKYQLQTTTKPMATSQDKQWITAERLTNDAVQLLTKNVSYAPQSSEKYEQALSAWRDLGDLYGEAFVLRQLSRIWGGGYLHDYQKAIDYSNQELAIRRKLQDRLGEAASLTTLASAFQTNKQFDKALETYEQALTLSRELKDLKSENDTLTGMADLYLILNRWEKEIEMMEQSLPIDRTLQDKSKEINDLGRIGRAYRNLRQNQKAIEYLEKALRVESQESDSRANSSRAQAMTNLASIYQTLGNFEKTTEYYEKALSLAQRTNNVDSEVLTLHNLGNSYMRMGQQEKAIESFEQALLRAQKIGRFTSEFLARERLGEIFRTQKHYEKAIEVLEQNLARTREVKNRRFEADALMTLGDTYSLINQPEKSDGYYKQALFINRAMKRDETSPLRGLMILWKDYNKPLLATFYGKQVINFYQEQRNNLRSFDRETQQSFLFFREKTYRQLADLLIAQGRLPEAEQVIRILKEDEYFEYIRRDESNSPKAQKAALTPEEAAFDKRYREIADQLTEIGTERATLQEKKTRTPEEEQRLAKLEADLVVAGKAFQKFLDGLAAEMGKNADTNARAFQLRESQGLMEDLRELGKGVVALYTLVGEDKYRVILTTADFQKGYEYPIKAEELNRKVLAFRDVLQNPKLDPLPLAQELYKILVGPVAKDLQGTKAQTVMWSLDGVLRYLPVAALHDGKQYLVERYRTAVFTPASQSRLRVEPSRKWTALGLGVTKAHGLTIPALPGVLEEMRGIIQEAGTKTGVLPGSIKLDEAFTQEAMLSELRKRNPVVHIASHFKFQPGNETNSALLLGDGNFLSLAQIKSLPNVFAGVDLLTLSACNTATGGSGANGKEVEGFGVLAQRQGAKAVVASLWPVADRSTKNLMQEFYKLREAKADVTKVEALRQAQIKLLRGELQVTGETLAARSINHEEDKTANLLKFKVDPKAPYAHPYYWAPFILIGNWK